MKRFSRSTVSATDLLLNLVMTEDCALSNIRCPSFAELHFRTPTPVCTPGVEVLVQHQLPRLPTSGSNLSSHSDCAGNDLLGGLLRKTTRDHPVNVSNG
jgi:hypothetical protein